MSFNLSKYSWKVRRALDGSQPTAANFASDSVTANAAEWNGDQLESFGIKPYAITDALSVSPWRSGIFAAIASSGVSWYFPANGIKTVAAPMEESKRSESPFCAQTSRRDKFAFSASAGVSAFNTSGTAVR